MSDFISVPGGLVAPPLRRDEIVREIFCEFGIRGNGWRSGIDKEPPSVRCGKVFHEFASTLDRDISIGVDSTPGPSRGAGTGVVRNGGLYDRQVAAIVKDSAA